MVVSTESLTIALMPSLVSLKKCSLPVEFGPLRVLTLLVPSSSPRRISMCLLGSFMIIVLSTIITSRTILLFHAKTTSFMPELVARSSPRWISRWHIIKVSWKSRISTRQHLRLPSVCSSGLSCPQGLCNAVTTFQRFMNWVLRKYIGRFCHMYIDDILVWSDSIAQHRHHMRLICQALWEHGVMLSKSKSILATDKVEFLGFNISYSSIEVTPEKVDKIIGSHIPHNPREVREFNGLVNYIGLFIPGLSHWSTVLSHLTKKNVVFHWGKEQQEAFDNIKRLTRNTPICRPINPDSSDPVMLVADASNRAIGGYVGQGKDYKTM